jgi:DNA sulfur modification protein DndC
MSRATQASAFAGRGLSATLEDLLERTRRLYLEDDVPWVVGYSGGKDSTATLQLVWLAIEALPAAERTKPIHVISTDTLVENPIVAAWVGRSLEVMRTRAEELGLPLVAHRLTPKVTDTFWVNLIGKGYPAPRPKFRWCTERMKINPSNAFIRGVVADHGEAILVLGIRKAESAVRARSMERQETKRVRDLLSPNASLPNSLVYSPIEEWSNDDVWTYLMQQANPWGYDNKDLLTMYQGASADGECPLVVDSSTPSCGDSRFGCWTCTLVEQDKSMAAMIQNDAEKEWMLPLLELRNRLDVADDRDLRDFRRINGRVQLFNDRLIHGPYTQQSRARWLRELLEAQRWIREHAPQDVRDTQLISLDELREIRRIWVAEKREFEDLLPDLYEKALGEPYPDGPLDGHLPLGRDELDVLRELCADDELHYQLVRALLDLQRRQKLSLRRRGHLDDVRGTIERHFFDDAEDALTMALRRRDRMSGPRDEATDDLLMLEYVRPAGDAPLA